MKKTLLALACLGLIAKPACAQRSGQIGLGFIAGSPFGVTGKFQYNDLLALDGGIGYANAAVFYADMLLNSWTLLRQPSRGRANAYVGAGPRIATDDGGQFAVRAMGGVGYWPSNVPMELFAEFGPAFKITPDNKVGVDGGVGLRYYFTVSLAPAR